MKKQVLIGTYHLGEEGIRLYGMTDNNGGESYFSPDDSGKPVIKVGLSDNDWDYTVSILLHETLEFALLRSSTGYKPIQDTRSSTLNRLFVLSHQQLDEACERQAVFIASALPELATAWKKNQKRKPE